MDPTASDVEPTSHAQQAVDRALANPGRALALVWANTPESIVEFDPRSVRVPGFEPADLVTYAERGAPEICVLSFKRAGDPAEPQ